MNQRVSSWVLLITGLTASALFGSGSASDEEVEPYRPGDSWRTRLQAFRQAARALSLTSEQQSRVEKIFDHFRPRLAEVQHELDAVSQRLQLLMPDCAHYHATLEGLSACQGALTTQRALVAGELRAHVFEVLTRQQQGCLPDLKRAWLLGVGVGAGVRTDDPAIQAATAPS